MHSKGKWSPAKGSIFFHCRAAAPEWTSDRRAAAKTPDRAAGAIPGRSVAGRPGLPGDDIIINERAADVQRKGEIILQQFAFGKLSGGELVTAYRISNRTGMQAVILDYGCIVQSLTVPNREGGETDVVLGYDSAAEYEAHGGFFGAAIGRVGNRIGGSAFTLDGETYRLPANEGGNHLHGGAQGFDRRLWSAECRGEKLVFSRTSPDGEEGYPGALAVQITYELLDGNALRIRYDAKTDRATPVNLTNHSYFNLHGGGDVLGHTLQLNAGAYTEIDEQWIPTGRLLPVAGTPMDFRQPKEIGRDLHADFEQLRLAGGYDHNYVLGGADYAARLYGPDSGILMTVETTEPGVQVYSGNSITPRRGKNGAALTIHSGVCLETQNFPDAVHHSDFPCPILRPDSRFHSTTTFTFSVQM